MSEYSQVCFTCGVDRLLSRYAWHTVTWYVTADKRKPVPGGAIYGGPDRTCKACWNAWGQLYSPGFGS